MEYVKHLPVNTQGRDFVIGDVHGCLTDVMRLLDCVGFDEDIDRLISVGDLIDRGPQSFDTLKLLDYNWFHCVKGNHEQMLLDMCRTNDSYAQQLFLVNGGSWYTQLTDEQMQELERYLDYIEQLPLIIVVGQSTDKRYNVVHAEFDQSTTDQDVDDFSRYNHAGTSLDREGPLTDDMHRLNWGRTMISAAGALYGDVQNGLSLTFVGHTPILRPVRVGNQLYIDGGAVFKSSTGTGMNMVDVNRQVIISLPNGSKTMTEMSIDDVEALAQ